VAQRHRRDAAGHGRRVDAHVLRQPVPPWVFLVGADGNIVQRWDNGATEAELARAVEALIG
jgi:hypothetical protein